MWSINQNNLSCHNSSTNTWHTLKNYPRLSKRRYSHVWLHLFAYDIFEIYRNGNVSHFQCLIKFDWFSNEITSCCHIQKTARIFLKLYWNSYAWPKEHNVSLFRRSYDCNSNVTLVRDIYAFILIQLLPWLVSESSIPIKCKIT